MATATLVQNVIGDSVPSNTNNFDIGGGVEGNMVVFPGDTAVGSILAAFVATAIDGTNHITGISDSVSGNWGSVIDSVNDATADQWVGTFASSVVTAPLKVAAWSGTACTIASGTLTVGGTFSGIVRIGQLITGTVANLRITAFVTGAGGAGTYTINNNTASFLSGTLGGSDAITVTYSAFGDFQGTWAIEVSGSTGVVAAHAGKIQASASGTDSWTSGTASCPGNGLMVGFANNASESAAVFAPNAGTGFTNSQKMWQWSNTQNNATGEWAHFTAPGTKASTFTPTAADSADVFMLFFQDSSTSQADTSQQFTPGFKFSYPLKRLNRAIAAMNAGFSVGPLTALGTSGSAGFASLQGTGALVSFGASGSSGRAALGGSGALQALGTSGSAGEASVLGIFAVTSFGATGTAGQASLTGTGNLVALGVTGTAGFSSMGGTGALLAFGTSGSAGEASLVVGGTSTPITAFGVSGSAAQASLAGIANLTALGLSGTAGTSSLAGVGALQALALTGSAGEASLSATLALTAFGASGSASFADLEALSPGSFFVFGASGSAGFANLLSSTPAVPIPTTLMGGGMGAGGDVGKPKKRDRYNRFGKDPQLAPKTAIELERGFRYPWDATGDPIVVSPNMGRTEETYSAPIAAAPIIESIAAAMPQSVSVEVSNELSDAHLLMLLAAILD